MSPKPTHLFEFKCIALITRLVTFGPRNGVFMIMFVYSSFALFLFKADKFHRTAQS